MSIILRMPNQFRPLTGSVALRDARNEIRAPLNRLARKLRAFPNPDCYFIDYALGYSANQLRKHVESLFEEGMSWDNSSTWLLEHIVPVHHYLQNGVTNPRIINALKNLQPVIDLERQRNPKEIDKDKRRDYMRDYMKKYNEKARKERANVN